MRIPLDSIFLLGKLSAASSLRTGRVRRVVRIALYTFASLVSIKSSHGFEYSTTNESEYNEDDDGLIQSLHSINPSQLCYLSFDLFSLTVG